MKGALVIGLGNPLRGDDGAGHHVIAALLERRPHLRGLAVHQLTIDLAEDVATSAEVIFVDASVQTRSVKARRVELEHSLFTSHHLTPGTLLSAAESLYGARPPAWIVEVPAFALDHGDTLSPEAQIAVREATAEVEALLEGRASVEPPPRSEDD